MKLRTNLDSTTNEKDLIGTQMIRRNDEIGLLNEKINIITMALDRGNLDYSKLVLCQINSLSQAKPSTTNDWTISDC